MERKQNWQHIEQLLKENGITKLYHFTDERNIESIIRNGGLYSWGDCVDNNIEVQVPGGSDASHSMDYHKKLQYHVRLSFVKNHPMKYIAQSDERQLQPVVLEISPEVLFWKHTKFSDQNAVKTGTHISENPNDFDKLIHFNVIKTTNGYDLPEEEKSYFQAEVLVQHCIPLNYILNFDNIIQTYLPEWDFETFPLSKQLSIIQKRALLNEPISQFFLAQHYQYGEGVDEDKNLAINWYLKSANNGYTDAYCSLGRLFREKKDYTNASFWYQKAIDNNIVEAYRYMAVMQIYDIATPKSIEEGFQYLQKGTEHGDIKSTFYLGMKYMCGYNYDSKQIIAIDKDKGIKLLEQAADNGLINAQKYLGDYYRTKNENWNAIHYYKLAADQGDSYAQFYAAFYFKYIGRYEDAVKYYQLAVGQGNTSAMNNLAVCYEYGQGVEKNEEEAFKLYKIAAEYGDAMAQNNLANCYEVGTGIDINIDNSMLWRKKAAENKNLNATHKLAHFYENVDRNIDMAKRWYLQLAEIGTAEDMYDASQFFKKIKEKSIYKKLLLLSAEKKYEKALCDLGLYDQLSTKTDSAHGECETDGIIYSKDQIYVLKSNYKIKKAHIKEGVLILADKSFLYKDLLTEVNIPKSVVAIGKSVFAACNKLTSIICESPNFTTSNGFLLSADKKRLLTYFGEIENIIVPEGVVTIDEGAFCLKKIKTIVLPNTLKSIGDGAFACCSNLTMVYMHNNVEEIGKHAFEECKRLKSITFSSKLKNIAKYAFRYSGLEELIVPDTMNIIEDYAFYGCSELKKVDLGNGIKTLGNSVFNNCNKLENIRLSNNINSIGELALITAQNIITSNNKFYFSDGHALYKNTPDGIFLCRYFASDETIEITLPIVGIENFAFYNNTAKRILLPPSIKEIGVFCFAKCTYLENISLPENLTSIPKGTFEECKILRKVMLPYNVESIDRQSSLGYSEKITRHCIILNDNIELSYDKLDNYGHIPINHSGEDRYEYKISGRRGGCNTPLIIDRGELPQLNVILHIHPNTKNRIYNDLLNKVVDIIEFNE